MGPLKDVKILEVGGIGPGPFCAHVLADMGADIIRVDRKGQTALLVESKYDIWRRGRRSITLDLRKPEGVELALTLIEKADALIEGFRPGVMEKLGLSPEICLKRNPKLVFGRMTGWGQEGPLSKVAGHDINYIALSGALHAIGQAGENPSIPLNLVGDLGGGGMFLAFGIMCALYEAQKSGKGQVVDAAMVDGASILMGAFYGMWAAGVCNDKRGTNMLDGGAHFYNTYETKDGKWVAIGSIEPQFYALLLKHAGIEDDPDFNNQLDIAKWPELKKKLAEIFKNKTRDQWCEIMGDVDICFAPVLSYEEAVKHPHNVARKTFIEIDGIAQPAPAPRFSRTKTDIPLHPPKPGEHNRSALLDWGISDTEIEKLKKADVI